MEVNFKKPNAFSRFKTWLSHVINIVPYNLLRATETIRVANAIAITKIEAQRAIAALRAEHDAAISELEQKLSAVQKSFDIQIGHLHALTGWLEVSKRDASGVVGSKPVPPQA